MSRTTTELGHAIDGVTAARTYQLGNNDMTTKNQCAVELSKIMGTLGGVDKDGKLSTGRYTHNFRSKESLYAELRPRLSAAGIIMIPITKTHSKIGDFVSIAFDVLFIHGETGSEVRAGWCVESADTQDKATSKAWTSGLRTFLDNFFMIGSDDDKGSNDYENQERRQHTPPPAQEETKTLRDIGIKMNSVGFSGDEIKSYVGSWGKEQGHDSPQDIPPSLIASWLRKVDNLSDDQIREVINKRLGADVSAANENPYA